MFQLKCTDPWQVSSPPVPLRRNWSELWDLWVCYGPDDCTIFHLDAWLGYCFDTSIQTTQLLIDLYRTMSRRCQMAASLEGLVWLKGAMMAAKRGLPDFIPNFIVYQNQIDSCCNRNLPGLFPASHEGWFWEFSLFQKRVNSELKVMETKNFLRWISGVCTFSSCKSQLKSHFHCFFCVRRRNQSDGMWWSRQRAWTKILVMSEFGVVCCAVAYWKTWEHELAELTPVLLSPSVLWLLRPWLSCCNIERNRETRQLKSKCWKAGQHRNHHRTMEPWNHCLPVPALILGINNTKWLERYWIIAADIKCFVMISDVISRLCVYTQLQSAASSQTVRRRIVLRMSS